MVGKGVYKQLNDYIQKDVGVKTETVCVEDCNPCLLKDSFRLRYNEILRKVSRCLRFLFLRKIQRTNLHKSFVNNIQITKSFSLVRQSAIRWETGYKIFSALYIISRR